MRALLLALLLAGTAAAQTSDIGIWFPTTTLLTNGNPSDGIWQASDVMLCADFIPAVGVTNATSMSFGGSTTSSTCGLAFYDATGTTVIRAATGTCGNTRSQFTGLTAFSLTAGTVYRGCWCIKNSTGGYYSYNGGSGNIADLLNTYATHLGTAANSCTNGITPATTGSLTPLSTEQVIAIWVSKE